MMRFLAWLSAVFWIGLGIVFLLRMPQMAEGLAFTSPDGLTGLRAIVSGLHIAIGTVILVFCLNRLYLLGVFVSAWRSERTCDCQIVWNVTDRAFTASQIRDLVPEVLGLFIAIAILPRLRSELGVLARAVVEQGRHQSRSDSAAGRA